MLCPCRRNRYGRTRNNIMDKIYGVYIVVTCYVSAWPVNLLMSFASSTEVYWHAMLHNWYFNQYYYLGSLQFNDGYKQDHKFGMPCQYIMNTKIWVSWHTYHFTCTGLLIWYTNNDHNYKVSSGRYLDNTCVDRPYTVYWKTHHSLSPDWFHSRAR